MAAPERRRRARLLVVALVTVLVGTALLGIGPAGARGGRPTAQQQCTPFPFCQSFPVSSTSSTGDVTTTTEDDDVTTTTEDDDDVTTTTEEERDEDETETTRDRTPTTEERVTTTVFRVSTSLDLLVPGDGTEGAESTTTTEAALVSGDDGGLSDNQLVALIVGGLVVLGGAVGTLTWRYWRATEPVEVPLEPISREPQGPRARTQRSVFLDP